MKYDLKIHLVFILKYMKKVLFWKVAEEIRYYLKKVCNELDIKIIKEKLAVDYAHMFVSHPPSLRWVKWLKR